jgi:hypothetical protein
VDRQHDDYQARASENASTLEREIDRLINGHWHMMQRQYREFWDHARRITDQFKALKPLRKADRERLWERLSAQCEKTKRKQDEEFRARADGSRRKRELVEAKIREAGNYVGAADDPRGLGQAGDRLNEAMKWMKGGWESVGLADDMLHISDGRLLKADREACWQLWVEVKEQQRRKRAELEDRAYAEFHRRASEALNTAHYGDPREAKGEVQAIQGDLRGTAMRDAQFSDIKRILQDAWKEASRRLKERYDEGQRQHQEWLADMRGHVERWSSILRKNEGVIARIEGDIANCEDMAANARTAEHADRVRGWIEEKYDKIRDIMATNSELEGRIRSVKSRIGS